MPSFPANKALQAARDRLGDSPFLSTRAPLLLLVYAVGLLFYLAVEPTATWIILVLTGLMALGTDGVLRTHPLAQQEREQDLLWTAPLLYLPALMTLGTGLFLEDVLSGYWIVPATLVATAVMGAVVYAEYLSVDVYGPAFAGARFLLNLGAFLTAFAFFAVIYTFDVGLMPAVFVVGLISLLLAIEVLRESEADPVRSLVYAGVIALIVAQARWALYFLPLESYLAAVFLLLVFYLASGVVQHHLNNDLRTPVITEFAAITVLGIAIVTLGRVFESGA